MSWYYSITFVNVKAILHSAVIVKIIFHPHSSIALRAIVNKKQCKMRGLFMSLAIH